MQISIVIPTVDRQEPLRHAVVNCLAQLGDGSRGEIVVVDNSADGEQAGIVGTIIAQNPAATSMVRYIHEPKPGLAYARNCGVKAANGAFIVFLDDDEAPRPGWLASLVAALEETGADAAFGAVEPQFEQQPARSAEFCRRLYTRRLSAKRHADISNHFNLLGTGNSCFRVATCFTSNPEPFDPRFNLTGGEDTDLLRRLRLRGCKFVWAGDAVVDEFVPASRLTTDYMGARRFMQGQMRSLSQVASVPKRLDKAAFWMAAGALQYIGHSFARMAAELLGRHEIADVHGVQAQGGLGKVLWQSHFRRIRYGRTSSL